jgi:hypothetical protein
LIAAEVVLFVQRERSEEQRLVMSAFESSIWLKTFEFLYFHKFHKKQVIMVEHVFWLGKGGPGIGKFQSEAE